MKYMGSKRYMLNNGLGKILKLYMPKATRFVDPFCGAGSVINYAAQNCKKQIIAGDLQEYAVVMARAVIERTRPLDSKHLQKIWIQIAESKLIRSKLYKKAADIEIKHATSIKSCVEKSRELCKVRSNIGPIWNAYGGFYYSPKQAIAFDYLIKYLPSKREYRNTCLAALIIAASRSAAAPGHTAQPFQPTRTAGKFIKIAWGIDPLVSCLSALKEIAPLHAKAKGRARVGDALKLANQIKPGDLVVIDPPYSGVQYSRFYHVLETIARGKCGKVEGVGRYPKLLERPQSAFSNAGQSLDALKKLMEKIAKKKATIVLTFPQGKCSNGLSGDEVIRAVKLWFKISNESRIHEHIITGKFSTLGGNNKLNRNNLIKRSRVKSKELLLLLKPKELRIK